LSYRTKCEQKEGTQPYKDWYQWNFNRTAEVVANVEHNLKLAFGEGETRITDLWVDLPAAPESHYVDLHLSQLDKDFKTMSHALKTTDKLTQSIA